MTIDEFMYSIWNFYAANLSKAAARNHYNIVKNYVSIIGHTPDKLTREDADTYNRYLINRVSSDRLSYTTAVMRVSVMRSLCEYIRLKQLRNGTDYINYFNEIILPEPDKQISQKDFPDYSELDAILSTIKNSGDDKAFLITVLAAKCGMTASQICNIRYEHIATDRNDHMCITVAQRHHMTRLIELPSDISDIMDSYINAHHITTGVIFSNNRNNPMTVRDAERLFKKYINAACDNGILHKSYTLQMLRHFAVVSMLKGGAATDMVAGYCGISTRWMNRYNTICDDSNINSTAGLSIISIRKGNKNTI